MREEWKGAEKVAPLEGWTLQVRESCLSFLGWFRHSDTVFHRVSCCIWCNFVLPFTFKRSHVYFKSQEMHGAFDTCFNSPVTLIPVTMRHGSAHRRPAPCYSRCVILHNPNAPWCCIIKLCYSVDREIEIIQKLLEKILAYREVISNACDVCAELDCLLSFAETSRLYGYRRPVMSEENIISIQQGRRVLQIFW